MRCSTVRLLAHLAVPPWKVIAIQETQQSSTGQALLTMMMASIAGQVAPSEPSTAMVDASVAERVGEGRMVEDASVTRAVGSA